LPFKSKAFYFLALFLAAVFLAAQLHCCIDLNSRTMDSHACPVCHTAGAAIATSAVIFNASRAMRRLEILPTLPPALLVIFRNLTPRAPPVPC
jgi:hypothetical protein